MALYINFFVVLILITSLCVILSKNPVQSVLFLVLVFFFSSLLLLLIGAEFLAILLVIIYVGAISILFLFVVMMLNLKVVELHSTFYNYLPIELSLACFLFLKFCFLFLVN